MSILLCIYNVSNQTQMNYVRSLIAMFVCAVHLVSAFKATPLFVFFKHRTLGLGPKTTPPSCPLSVAFSGTPLVSTRDDTPRLEPKPHHPCLAGIADSLVIACLSLTSISSSMTRDPRSCYRRKVAFCSEAQNPRRRDQRTPP